MTSILNLLRTSLNASCFCLPALCAACGDAEDLETTPSDAAPTRETLVTFGSDGSVTEVERELGAEEREASETDKRELGQRASLPERAGGRLGSVAQPLVVDNRCSPSDLWLYDASGNRLCVRWVGDRDRGLDLASIQRGLTNCAITLSGRGIPCTWAEAVTSFWPGQYAGHLGTCTPLEVGFSCAMPVAFPAWGPRTNVDGRRINWVTMPS